MRLHRYRSSEGVEILVGRDDASNDELTFSVGRSNDVWLHVAGSPGSHVVLACAGRKGAAPDRQSLREAAALAAWHSKMRRGGRVAVHWCRVRDVRKPRGARPGSVVLRNEQKIQVRPCAHEELADPSGAPPES